MASPRTRISFDELIKSGLMEIGDGYRAKLGELGGDGPIFLRAGQLSDAGIDWSGCERFDSGLRRRLVGKMGLPGDTMVTTKGNSVGQSGYVPRESPEFVYSPHLSYWRSRDHTKLASRYLRYWARSPEFSRQLRALAHGTDMAPYLSLVDQRRLEITLPSGYEQQSIAEVLGALDDKIDANEQIISAGEALLRAQFDRLQSESSTRKGEPLGKLCENVRLMINPANVDPSTAYVGLEHMRRGSVVLREKGVAAEVMSGKSAFHRQDILFGKLRPYFRKVAIADEDGVCSSDILVLRVSDPEHLAFVLMLASSRNFIDFCDAISSGSRMPRVGWPDMARFSVLVPEPHRLNRFNDGAVKIVDRLMAASRESLALASLRDALLPPLMSGELRVRDVEALVGEAV